MYGMTIHTADDVCLTVFGELARQRPEVSLKNIL